MFEEETIMSGEEVGQEDQRFCKGKIDKPVEKRVKEIPQEKKKEKEKRAVRILIVDDEPDMLKALNDVFEKKGYDVEIALDGEEAIDKARERLFDIAFIDIRLPGINGVGTFQAIKKINPKMLALMITAYDLPDMVKRAMEEGAYICLLKPFDIDKVIGIIESYRKGMLE